MDPNARARLVSLLQRAYSGELAAAYAYSGHWRATRRPDERARIRVIEDEEWHHRRGVGEMLRDLGAGPRFFLEVRAWLIGRVLGFFCRLAGWFMPMYGAGKLESRNVGEYVTAAQDALACGRHDLVAPLLAMAEVEWEHEAYFRSRVEGHAWLRWFPLWPALPPRSTLRSLEAKTPASPEIEGVASTP